jgi:catechol 2,3-dioxygenase-like lactoylglutathione lyase family enzyme
MAQFVLDMFALADRLAVRKKGQTMIDYITIGVVDTAHAKTFYDAVLATIGWKPFADYGAYIGYGLDGVDDGQTIWICKPYDGQPARAGNGIMIGFHADTKDQVHAFHAAAMAADGSDEGAPGSRPDYGPNWYAAYLRDPTGNKLSIVWKKPAEA